MRDARPVGELSASTQALMQTTRVLRLQHQLLWFLEHGLRTVLRSRPVIAGPRRRVHTALVQRAMQLGDAVTPLPRTDQLTRLPATQPLVFSGAARHWPCIQRWTPQFIARVAAEHAVRLLAVGPGEARQPGAGTDVHYEDIADSMADGGPLYARFTGLLHQIPGLVEDVDLDWLRRARGGPARFENWGFFMGGAGTGTGLHSSIAPNLFVQVAGRKRWTVHAPACAPFLAPRATCAPYFTSAVDLHDPAATPWAGAVPGWTGVLEPGDVLWVPAFAWHQVENPTATIGVGYRWMSVGRGLRASLLQTLIAATSTNPVPWTARGHTDLPTLLDRVAT